MISIHCPTCDEECTHRILKESTDLLVQCTECGHVHHAQRPPAQKLLSIRTIVSRETESTVCIVEMTSDDYCNVGDMIVAECGDEALGVEITSIESGDRRVERAVASDVTTLWTRAIETVVLKVSIHSGRTTKPVYKPVEGEEMFVVGEVYTMGGSRFRISHIKLREGQVMRKEGWKAAARRIKRIYGYRV
ncbi:hypothetical protein ABH15_03835 [Methanoculleus taiwanensis]|uniref:Zn-finger protein n=1 Tax=Methanoculleus taiwanensis TaxID=1550565 RepID=A0A498H350_9EURY|nr:HVO_0476 family zinc finger protein [Methanoculleus taiwanensis]RXE57243.1 hypothetical protein ABH15_03835 [Methanoculleus taiwanensis]